MNMTVAEPEPLPTLLPPPPEPRQAPPLEPLDIRESMLRWNEWYDALEAVPEETEEPRQCVRTLPISGFEPHQCHADCNGWVREWIHWYSEP